MRKETKADIITIRSNRSEDDTKMLIENAIAGLRERNDEHVLTEKKGESVRVAGQSVKLPGKQFAVEITTRRFDGYIDIDIAALGGELANDEAGSKKKNILIADQEESDRMRNILIADMTTGRKCEIKERLAFLKNVSRREVSKKIKAARENGKPLYENAEYDAARDSQERIENEIKELQNELDYYESAVRPEIRKPDSIFSCNTRYYDYSDRELAKKTGISLERIRQIGDGAEPLLSELLSISTAFDVEFEALIFSEWFRHQFGEYYSYSGSTVAESVEKGDVRRTAFLASAALIKIGDDIICKGRYKLNPDNKPDEELLNKARLLLLENGMPDIAASVSSKTNYLGNASLEGLGLNEAILRRYLFDGGTGSAFSYFIPFFNRLEREDDKTQLLNMLHENLKSYMGKAEYSIDTDASGMRSIHFTETDAKGRQMRRMPWFYRDFSGLETGNPLKEEIIRMQDELFENLPC